MIDRPFKPGERVAALVNGEHTHIVFSLETEEKGDRRDHCWRYDLPNFPIVPKDYKVEPLEFVMLKGNAPDATKLMK